MAAEVKPVVDFDETFDKLDIRVGRIMEVETENLTPKKTYRMLIDFGKFGRKTAYGRFTLNSEEEVKGLLVLGVLNCGARKMGPVESEVRILGVQYRKAESGEALFVSPVKDCKLGSKLF